MLEQASMKRLKALTYLRMEIKNPLYGIMFTQTMMERTALREDQRQLVETTHFAKNRS
jgi:phytochrome A